MPAKFNVLVAVAIPLAPVIPLLACGGSDAKPDAHLVVHDSPNGSGSGSGSGSGACPVNSNFGSPTIGNSASFYTAGSAADATNVLDWEGLLPASDEEILSIRIFGGCGSGIGSACGGTTQQPAATPDWPTTFAPKSGINLMTAPDAVAVIFAGIGSNGMASSIYVSETGTLNVTAAQNGVGHNYAGNLANATFVRVDPSTGMPTSDNCMSAVTAVTFSGSAMAGFGGKDAVVGAQNEAAIRAYLAHRYQ
jgi:hypothetical protein